MYMPLLMSVTLRNAHLVCYVQWNPSITDTLGTQIFVRYNEVSLSQYISGRHGNA